MSGAAQRPLNIFLCIAPICSQCYGVEASLQDLEMSRPKEGSDNKFQLVCWGGGGRKFV